MISYVFFWWLLFFFFGLVSLPLAQILFDRFYDRGYIFAKVITLMLVSYLVWWFGILKIVPFTRSSILFFLGLVLVLNLFLAKKQKDFGQNLKNLSRVIILEEILFFIGLYLWSYIRAHQPNIHGLEKFMDFGFINAILRSRFFPPNDMWLSGESINYYYFGHLETALLTKLTGIGPAIAYNLTLGNLCGLMLSATYSLSSNLIHWALPQPKRRHLLSGGLVSAILLTFGGNFQILYHWLREKTLETYWYPDATRFIIEKFGAADNTIHEFPIYSLVVADLHGHLLNIPQVLLIVALIILLVKRISAAAEKPNLITKTKRLLEKLVGQLTFLLTKELVNHPLFKKAQAELEKVLAEFPLLLLLGITLGITFMTNAWDYPIYLLYAGAAVLWFSYLKSDDKMAVLIKTGFFCLFLLIISVLTALPFYLNFDNIAQGVALADFHSPPWMLLFLWAFPLFCSICFVALLKKLGRNVRDSDYLAVAFLAVSWLLIVLPEVIRIKDIYIHSHQRANTLFKLTYQAFMVFRILSGYILVRIVTQTRQKYLRKAFLLLFLAGMTVLLVYPRFAVRSYYDRLQNFKGLDGLSYLENLYPDDYQAIIWLNQEIEGDPVIAEAVGESYTDFARVSANTGLPTIVGWRVHEWLWRGTFDIAGARTEEVTKIYTSPDLGEVKEVLDKYKVEYIFVGAMEKEAYPNMNETNFDSLGEVVFTSGQTKIYQVN